MADQHQEVRQDAPTEPGQQPRSWDYSTDPMKDGGTQIATMVIGFAVTFVLMALLAVVWALVMR